MISLAHPELFSRALSKAIETKPAVQHAGAKYFVSRSDGGQALVKFVACRGSLWATCTCPAGSPVPRSGRKPIPCYHVGAALLLSDAIRRRIAQADETNGVDLIGADHRDRDFWN